MSVQLRPSFLRCVTWVALAMGVVTGVAYFSQGYRENHWWTGDYTLYLLIPFSIGPLLIWFMFVPSRLEFRTASSRLSFHFDRSTSSIGPIYGTTVPARTVS